MLLPEHRLRNMKSREQASLVSNIIQEHKLISGKGVKGITVSSEINHRWRRAIALRSPPHAH